MGSVFTCVLRCPYDKVTRIDSTNSCNWDAGGRWRYNPCVKAMSTNRIDPAYLVRMQFQMQATGVSHGYSISWSRNDISVHCSHCNPAFIHSAAKVLKFAIEAFVNPEGTPAIPSNMSQMEGPLKHACGHMVQQLKGMVKSCVRNQLDSG